MTEPTIAPESCRSCGAPIIWCLSSITGRPLPVDAVPVAGGNLLLVRRLRPLPARVVARRLSRELAEGRTDLHVAHFATCPDGDEWRKPRRSAA